MRKTEERLTSHCSCLLQLCNIKIVEIADATQSWENMMNVNLHGVLKQAAPTENERNNRKIMREWHQTGLKRYGFSISRMNRRLPSIVSFNLSNFINFSPWFPKDLQGLSQNWTLERKVRLRRNCSHPPMSFKRDVLQTEIRKLWRKRAEAGREVRNKMAHFRENPSERSARGPWNRTKFSVRFRLAGSSLPMWQCALAVSDCRTLHQLLLFLSLLQLCHHFRDRRALQSRFRLLQYSPAPNSRLLRYHRSLPSTASWEDLKEVYFVRRKQRVKGRGKEKKKDNVTSHQRKGSLQYPLSAFHSPFAFYSPSCKTVLLLPRWLSVPLRTALTTGKPVKRRSSSPRPLCHFVPREQQSFHQNLLEHPQSLCSPSALAEPKMKPKINFLFAEQAFGSHMFVCTLTLPGQNPDADLSENRTGFGLQNIPIGSCTSVT